VEPERVLAFAGHLELDGRGSGEARTSEVAPQKTRDHLPEQTVQRDGVHVSYFERFSRG
jgi:hypothetical protein